MSFRRTLWQLHRWLGIGTGMLLFVVALTGVVLIWSHELNLRGHHPLPEQATNEVSAALPAALADFVEAHPACRLGAIILPRRATAARAWQVYLRPADGGASIVGEFDPSRAALLATHGSDAGWRRLLVNIHYKFLLGTPGAYLCGVVALVLVLLSLSGLLFYRAVWRELFRWRPGRTLRTGTGWLHRWLGAWSLLLALIWGITGVLYIWMLFPGRPARGPREAAPVPPAALRQVRDLPALFSAAHSALPGGEVVSVRFLADQERQPLVTLRTLHRDRWFWEKIGTVTLDGRTAEIRSLREPGTGTPRERLLAIMAALHFGSQGGRLQQLVWTAGGLVLCFLPLSGYALWLWRRRHAALRSATATERETAHSLSTA